jgi:SH3-like domain-containing protein
MQARILRGYRRTYDNPLVVRKGDPVRVGRPDDEFPGWWWCAGPDNRQGWVHEKYLDQKRPTATAVADYSAMELDCEKGDLVEVLIELGGWTLCRKADGAVGWVPTTHVGREDVSKSPFS